MQNHRALAVVGCIVIFGGAALEYSLGPLAVAKPRRLPVETFPARIGDWQGGTIQTVDPDIQARLPTAMISDREYADPAGRSIDVMLVTASDSLDIHSPLDCFPSQGWHLSQPKQINLRGQSMYVMDALQNDQKLTIMYWTTGYYTPAPSHNVLIRKASDFRNELVPNHEGESLFVRLIAPATPAGDQGLSELAGQMVPSVRDLLKAGLTPEERERGLVQVSRIPFSRIPSRQENKKLGREIRFSLYS